MCWWGLNFVSGDRDQSFLFRRTCVTGFQLIIWLWFVVDMVDQIDLRAFRRAYRPVEVHRDPTLKPSTKIKETQSSRRES